MADFPDQRPSSTEAFALCEKEPIHVPGSIQGHGVLVGVDESAGCVRFVSENPAGLFDVSPGQLLGRPWSEAAGLMGLPANVAGAEPPDGPAHFAFTVTVGGRSLRGLAHRLDGVAIWEFEPEAAGAAEAIAEAESQFSDDWPAFQVAQEVAARVAAISGFDRVMVYRFHPDWTGEVIAEQRRTDLTPFLGLRYPATDIPSQARELYRKNLLRVVADVHSIPMRLFAVEGSPPLDLSHATLRSVSPYHIDYLKNMGVAATLTISILVRGELWGMMACHHHGARMLSWARRERCGEVTKAFGEWLERSEIREQAARESLLARDVVRLKEIYENTPTHERLARMLFSPQRIDALLGADAVAIFCAGELVVTGSAPDNAWLMSLANWLLARPAGEPVYAADRLPDELPPPAASGGMCGVLAAVVARGDCPLVVCVFRGELEREVHWGGDPNRAVVAGPGNRVMPRDSFELWRQVVRGTSRPWVPASLARMNLLREIFGAVGGGQPFAESLQTGLREMLGAHDEAIFGSRVMDVARDGITIFTRVNEDGEELIFSASSRFNELFGFDSLEAIGQPAEALLRQVGLRLDDLPDERRKVEMWSRQWGPRTLLVSRRDLLRLSSGSAERRMSVVDFLDITIDQRLSDAVEVARRQALAASEAKSMLLANVSHELRTPLNAIIGFGQIMAAEDHGVPEYADFNREIVNAGEHLLRLVEDLLEVAQTEHQSARSQAEQTDLTDLSLEACRWLQPLAADKGVRFEFSLPEGPVPFLGEPTRLRQVLLNLLSNALKFTPANGLVQCRLAVLADRTALLEIIDSGIGIPAAHLPRIFDRFYQVDGSSTREQGGAGLGLAIVKANVEMHGGTINLSSREGLGTHVRVSLPASRMVGRAA